MTTQEREVIEVLILRQIALYNQKLFKAGLVCFEYRLTEEQQGILNTELNEVSARLSAKDAAAALILSRQQEEIRDLQRRIQTLEQQYK